MVITWGHDLDKKTDYFLSIFLPRSISSEIVEESRLSWQDENKIPCTCGWRSKLRTFLILVFSEVYNTLFNACWREEICYTCNVEWMISLVHTCMSLVKRMFYITKRFGFSPHIIISFDFIFLSTFFVQNSYINKNSYSNAKQNEIIT